MRLKMKNNDDKKIALKVASSMPISEIYKRRWNK